MAAFRPPWEGGASWPSGSGAGCTTMVGRTGGSVRMGVGTTVTVGAGWG